MKAEIRERVLLAAAHILKTGATVRACAGLFGVSKTTIHKDMRERLPRLNPAMSRSVDAVLRKNLEERHLRGGEATRWKYKRSGDSALREDRTRRESRRGSGRPGTAAWKAPAGNKGGPARALRGGPEHTPS